MQRGEPSSDPSAIEEDENTTDNVQQKINGPVTGMKQAAALLGGKLTYDEEGFRIDFPYNNNHLHINKGANSTWKRKVTHIITDVITTQLAQRVSNPTTDKTERRKNTRTDYYGMTGNIDTYATTALLRNNAEAVLNRHKDILKKTKLEIDTKTIAKDPITNQRLQSIIAGALRAPDRLHEAGILENTNCKFCECQHATLEHVIWECPKWQTDRQRYIEAIVEHVRKTSENNPAKRERLIAHTTLPCWKNCGIIPESDYFIKGGATILKDQHNEESVNTQLNDLTEKQQQDLVRDELNRITAYTDGAACNPEDPRRRRAAWGVFYAHDHPYNRSAPLKGEIQTVYRAELKAVVHVLTAATIPTRIVTDCQAVANQVHDIIHGERTNLKGDHADLWKIAEEAIRKRDPNFFEIEWVTSHIELEKAGEIEAAGGFSKASIFGNHWADHQAKTGLQEHPIDWEEYQEADDRAFITIVAQAMALKVWTNFFTEDNEVREAHEAEEEGEELPTQYRNRNTNLQKKNKAAEQNKDQPNKRCNQTTTTDVDMEADDWLKQRDFHFLSQTKQNQDIDPEEEAANWLHGDNTTVLQDQVASMRGPLKRSHSGNEEAPNENQTQELVTEISTNNYDQQMIKRPRANQIQHQASDTNYDVITLPDTEETIHFQSRGTQNIQGRGVVDVSVKHPFIYIEYVKKWFNMLAWKPRDPNERPNSPGETVTYLECLVDFELTTGIKFGNEGPHPLSWAERARILAYYVKTLARVYTVKLNNIQVPFKQAMRPMLDAAPLAPLGAPVLSGYGRKPIWTHPGTHTAIVTNVRKARANDPQNHATTAEERRNRSFAHRWPMTLSGHKIGKWMMDDHAHKNKRKASEANTTNPRRNQQQNDVKCASCHFNEVNDSNSAFKIPRVKGWKWRGVRPGELICNTCHSSWTKDHHAHNTKEEKHREDKINSTNKISGTKTTQANEQRKRKRTPTPATDERQDDLEERKLTFLMSAPRKSSTADYLGCDVPLPKMTRAEKADNTTKGETNKPTNTTSTTTTLQLDEDRLQSGVTSSDLYEATRTSTATSSREPWRPLQIQGGKGDYDYPKLKLTEGLHRNVPR